MSDEKFPEHIFPDIKDENSEFPKFKKKNISEDFIAENFKRHGWTVYTPYVDTGLDMIITKPMKNSDGQTIKSTRFVQVKTRALKQTRKGSSPVLGYTLKTKDFREDPRGVFVFYNDNPKFNGHYDVFIIPMYYFFKFFYDNSDYSKLSHHGHMGESQFSTVTFRQENGKMNGIKYDLKKHQWAYSGHTSFNKFRNENGYNLINSLDIENHFTQYQNAINHMKQNLYYHKKKEQDLSSHHLKQSNKKLEQYYHASSNNINIFYNKLHQIYQRQIHESNNARKTRFMFMKNYIKNPKNVSHKALVSFYKYHNIERKN